MTPYLVIASRDPFECRDILTCYETAQSLARAGNGVTVFLVQNGVLPARPSMASQNLLELLNAGVTVLADEFSLAERGIDKPIPGVEVVAIDRVVALMADGAKTMWH